jgi:enoyl-[acyl-carrier protein] reductase I
VGLVSGKKALIFGVANERSIAWGIAQALHREGAELGFTYFGEALEKRVRPLAQSVNSRLIVSCDVGKDSDIEAVYAELAKTWGTFDILVHCIAFASKADLEGAFVNTTREGFRLTLDVSAYSLLAITRPALPLMNPGGAILTLSYYGSEKVIPNYNVMGVAKAALEASVRYLAADLGPRNLRINAISAGPIKTLAASGIAGFKSMLKEQSELTPLKRGVSQEEVGNAALYLLSPLSSGVTGEVHYVDAGANIIGMKLQEKTGTSNE